MSNRNLQDVAEDRLERFFWLLVLLVMAMAIALRLPDIATRSLWIDELYTEWFARRSFLELWTDVPDYETHPPFYYSLLRLWTFAFGNSELGLRSLSLVLSLATVFTVAVSGKLLKARRLGLAVGLVGAALLAMNYASIREAQNARPYALQGMVSTIPILAALALVDRLRRGARMSGGEGGWLAPALTLGLSAGVGLWIHNTGFFIALGLWSGLALTLVLAPAGDRPRQLGITFAAGMLALVVWAPYLPIFLEQSGRFMSQAFWLIPKTRDLYSAWLFLIGPSWPVLLLAVALLLLGLYRLARAAPAWAIIVLAVLVLPLYATLAVSFAIKPIYIQRLFAWMVPIALLIMALGIVTATRSLLPRLLLGLLVASATVAQTLGDYSRPFDDWKAISAEIADHAEPGDVVIAVPAEGSIAVGYYAARHPGFPPVVCVPGCYPQRNLDRTYISNLGAPKLIEADGAIVDEALGTHKRVWLVQVSISLYDPESIVRKRIAASRKFVRFTGNSFAKVELFE